MEAHGHALHGHTVALHALHALRAVRHTVYRLKGVGGGDGTHDPGHRLGCRGFQKRQRGHDWVEEAADEINDKVRVDGAKALGVQKAVESNLEGLGKKK